MTNTMELLQTMAKMLDFIQESWEDIGLVYFRFFNNHFNYYIDNRP